MGEAKRRGSAEERKSAAMMNNEDILRLFKEGKAPHYAIILDRSETGLKVLEQLKRGPAELQARANSSAVELWYSMPQFAFVLIWGTWGYSGGLTLPTANMEFLLGEAIPKAMERTTEKGGLCAFIPCVDKSLHEPILNKVAELQPTSGQTLN